MRAQDLRAFVHRDWAAVRRAKDAYWRALAQVGASGPLLRAADGLRAHVAHHVGSAWTRQREADLAHHVELKRKIDAASARFRR